PTTPASTLFPYTTLFRSREPGNIVLELGAHTLSALLRIMGPVQSASVTVTNKVVLNNGQPFFKTWLANLMCERGPVQMHMSYGRSEEHTSELQSHLNLVC